MSNVVLALAVEAFVGMPKASRGALPHAKLPPRPTFELRPLAELLNPLPEALQSTELAIRTRTNEAAVDGRKFCVFENVDDVGDCR